MQFHASRFHVLHFQSPLQLSLEITVDEVRQLSLLPVDHVW